MKLHLQPLTTRDEICELVTQLQSQKMIAFDTEFIRENTFFPQVEILQIATADEAWLIDLKAFANEQGRKDLNSLCEVFKNPSILKIAHAIQADQECLFVALGILASPTLDTATAAALCGYGEGIGLGNLIKSVLGVNLVKGHARTNWAVRPLPDQLIQYALSDVEHLIEVAQVLLKELEALDRKEWAFELSAKWEDSALYLPDPNSITDKLSKSGRLDQKSYLALRELVRWREMRVRKLNLPRRWIADDTVLVDIARVQPKDLEHLSAFRGLNKGELKVSGEEILACLKQSQDKSESSVPIYKKNKPLVATTEEQQVLELLKCYIGILADQHQVAQKYLIQSSQLLLLLRMGSLSVEDLIKKEILSPQAGRLIGGELLAFVQGKRALSVKKMKSIKVVKLKDHESEESGNSP